jgi:hypothetical protein
MGAGRDVDVSRGRQADDAGVATGQVVVQGTGFVVGMRGLGAGVAGEDCP